MKYAVTYLLMATLIIGEIHTFFGRNIVSVIKDDKRVAMQVQPDGSMAPAPKYNWIINRYVPKTLPHNVKEASWQLMFILYFIAFYLYGKTPNKVNRATVIAFLGFVMMDGLMYFYNYKTFDYYYVYALFIILWLILLRKFKAIGK